MARPRDPNRDVAFSIYKKANGKIDLVEIASQLNISAGTVRGWKSKDKWEQQINGTLQKNTERSKRKKGGQPGNKNATGGPLGNKKAEKHGLFAKYLPADTMDIVNHMSLEPLDILWDQIQIAYAAIIRSQQIMYVRDQDDKTVERIERKDGNVIGESWEVQQAWDKQANFLKAQARAQGELRSLIKQYDEMVNKNWDTVTEEQRARIEHVRAQTVKIKSDAQPADIGKKVTIINDTRN